MTAANEKQGPWPRQGHDQGRSRRSGRQASLQRNAPERDINRAWKFGEFVEKVYFPYYSRKWKDSTRENNMNRMTIHLVSAFKDRELAGFRRDELQDLLDLKAKREGCRFRSSIICAGT